MAEAVQQLKIALLIVLGLGLADRGLAEHVEGESEAALAQLSELGQGCRGVAAEDEALREAQHLATDHRGGERRNQALL